MSIMSCDSCDAQIDTDYHEGYFNGDTFHCEDCLTRPEDKKPEEDK